MQTANEFNKTHEGTTNMLQNTVGGGNDIDFQGIPSLRPFRRPFNEVNQQLEDLEESPEQWLDKSLFLDTCYCGATGNSQMGSKKSSLGIGQPQIFALNFG